MSNKLLTNFRNKFLLLIMSIFSVVMIIAFAAVYFTIYNNIWQEIRARLLTGYAERVEIFDFGADMVSGRMDFFIDPLITVITLNEAGDILEINPALDMPVSIYEQLAATALREQNDFSVIRANNRQWSYVVNFGYAAIFGMDGGMEMMPTYRVILLDVTDYRNTLSSLLYTMLAVGAVLLIAIAAISVYFSSRAIRPIAEAWEKQRQFIADASHELKTPLAIMKSNLGIVISNQNETVGEQMEWLGYAEIGVNRMSKLATDLLALANADREDLHVVKAVFDISDAIIELAQAMTARAKEKGVEIATSVQPNITMHSDREKVIQIAAILLDNATKYSEPNGRVDVSLSKTSQNISLSVTNDGARIEQTQLPHIFDRFYQTDQSRNSGEGHGLGLSIAKSLSEKLGGSLFAESGERTTFTFILKAAGLRIINIAQPAGL